MQDITVVNGANNQTITPTADEKLTVGDVRKRLGDVLNIAPNAIALIGDEEVEEDRVIAGGERLQFIKRSGTKG